MRVNTNMNALLANNNMSKNTALAGSSMEKISSGLRITKAGDDAAGLAISEKMRSQIRGLDQAGRNVQDGISLIQTAEGAMEEVGNILHRMRELTVQAGNDTNDDAEREKIAGELAQLTSEIDRIAESTQFNGKDLTATKTDVILQVGANKDQTLTVTIESMKVADLGLDDVADIDITDSTKANETLEKIDTAIGNVTTARAALGATQNRLEYTQNNLTSSSENLTAAESRIRDVDVAKEMVNLSKLNILSQASQAMVAQANQQPQGVLQLLR